MVHRLPGKSALELLVKKRLNRLSRNVGQPIAAECREYVHVDHVPVEELGRVLERGKLDRFPFHRDEVTERSTRLETVRSGVYRTEPLGERVLGLRTRRQFRHRAKHDAPSNASK